MAHKRRSRRIAGSIRKLPSGRYQARFRSADGRLCPAPVTFRTKTEADLWLSSVSTDTASGEWVDPDAGRVLLCVYAGEWVEAKPLLAPKTVELYRYLLDALIVPDLGVLPLNELTPSASAPGVPRSSELDGPDPRRLQRPTGCFRVSCADRRYRQPDRAQPLQRAGSRLERPRETRIAGPTEISAIADAIEPRYRALVLTAAYGGCRWGELAGLRQRNLDLLHKRLTVAEQAIELASGERIVRPPKTDAGRRVVHLPAGVVLALERHLAEFVAPDPDGLVFTSENGGPLRQSNFRNRHWLPAVRVSGVEGLRLHDLRHVAGSLATVSGATSREVQARLGHASPAAAYRY